MVAIFTGLGLGVFNGHSVGGGGFGPTAYGRAGDTVSLNAATGNLVVQQQDEFLVGIGLDASANRSYNSQDSSGWRRVGRLNGLSANPLAQTGAINRVTADGRETEFALSGSQFKSTDGGGAHDHIEYDDRPDGGRWVWTEGSSGIQEEYDLTGKLLSRKDRDGNSVDYTYNADGRISKIETEQFRGESRDHIEYVYDATSVKTTVTTYENDDNGNEVAISSTRHYQFYDTNDRLILVYTDLTPEDNLLELNADFSTKTSESYATAYKYHGASQLLSEIIQSDGSRVLFKYTASPNEIDPRVTSIRQVQGGGQPALETKIAYDVNAGVTTITDPSGYKTEVHYDGQGRLVKTVMDSFTAGQSAISREYSYDMDDNLISLRATDGAVTKFTYDASGNQTSRTDSRGVTTYYEYDASNNLVSETLGAKTLISQNSAQGLLGSLSVGGGYEGTSYAPSVATVDGHEAVILDRTGYKTYSNGNQLLSTHRVMQGDLSDGRYYSIEGGEEIEFGFSAQNLIDTSGAAQLRLFVVSYGADGARLGSQSVQIASSDGWTDLNRKFVAHEDAVKVALTVIAYGRIGSSGSEPTQTKFAFRDVYLNRDLTDIEPQVARYVYDDEGHLRFQISAEGRVVEHEYNTKDKASEFVDGSLRFTRAFTEHRFTEVGAQLSVADMLAWKSSLGDLSNVKLIENRYDRHGQLSRVMTSVTKNADGTSNYGDGAVYSQQYMSYDSAGRLLSRGGYNMGVETFQYDGLDRMVASTNSLGATTNIVFNDTASKTVVSNGFGHVSTSVYDRAGRLVETISSDRNKGDSLVETDAVLAQTETTENIYDAEGRLRISVDAAGHKTFYIHDESGRLTAQVSASGEVSQMRYDERGRLIASVARSARLSPDDIGLDDVSVSPSLGVVTSSASDIWTFTGYDENGNVVRTILGDGSVSDFQYDAANRLVRTVSYVTKLSLNRIGRLRSGAASALTFDLTLGDGDVVSRSFYDRDGLMVGALSGTGYLIEFSYDANGQKIGEAAYANAPDAALLENGSFEALRDSIVADSAQDRQSHMVYDAQGNLRYEIDGYGQVTEYEYSFGPQSNGRDLSVVGLVRGTIRYAKRLSSLASYTMTTVEAALRPSAALDRVSHNVYNTQQQLIFSISFDGVVSENHYDKQGNIFATDVFATKFTDDLDGVPSLSEMRNWRNDNSANKRRTQSYFTASGTLRFSIDPSGYVTEYRYDARGQVVSQREWSKKVTEGVELTTNSIAAMQTGKRFESLFEYDPEGRLIATIDPLGVRRQTGYSGNGVKNYMLQGQNVSVASTVVYAHDAVGRITSTYNFDKGGLFSLESRYNQTVRVFDGLGNQIKSRIEAGTYAGFETQVSNFEYDKAGRVVKSTDAEGNVTEITYDAFGNITTQIDKRGGVTSFEYDKLGRVVKSTDAEGIVTETFYTNFGEISHVERAGVQLSKFTYNYTHVDGTFLTETDALGERTTRLLDVFGQVIWTTNKAGLVTNYVYDAGGRLEKEYYAAPTYTTVINPEGDWVRTFNGNGTITTRYEYDSRGNRTAIIEADGLPESRRTEFTYDDAGQLISKTQAEVSYYKSVLHATAHTVSPVETSIYDGRGNLIESKDAAGGRVLYFYDGMDRIIYQVSPTGTLTHNEYDAASNLRRVSVFEASLDLSLISSGALEIPITELVRALWSGARTTEFSYDRLNRQTESRLLGVTTASIKNRELTLNVSSSDNSVDLVTSYEYDAAGNVVRVTDPNGNKVYNYYDQIDRKTASVDAENYLTEWEYDARGNVAKETRFATALTQTPQIGTPPEAIAQAIPDPFYLYFAYVTEVPEQDRITEYRYDDLGQKISETRKNVLISNNAEMAPHTGYVLADSKVRFQYNALGNVIRKTEATGEKAYYEYDKVGRLIKEIRSSFLSAEKIKNADGTDSAKRKSVTPVTTYYYTGLGGVAQTKMGEEGAANYYQRITTNRFDETGRLIESRDPVGSVTRYDYDIAGRVIREVYSRHEASVVDPSQDVIRTEARSKVYDLAGRVVSEQILSGTQNSSGAITRWTADSNNARTNMIYDAFGNVVERQINGVTSETVSYDKGGRIWKSTAGDGIAKIFAYDANGNQTIAITSTGTDLSGLESEDAAFRLWGTSETNIRTIANRIEAQYKNGFVATLTEYDGRNKAVKVIEPERQKSLDPNVARETFETSIKYNAFGETIQQTNAFKDDLNLDGASLHYFYNTMGRQLRIINPTVLIHAATGGDKTIVAEEAVAGNPTEYMYYDISGRLTELRDGNGNLSRMSYLAGTGYNGTQGLITTVDQANRVITETQYDVFGNGLRVTDDNQNEDRWIEKTFDRSGQLITLRNPSKIVDRYSYDSQGQRYRTQYGNGHLHMSVQYDASGRIAGRSEMGGDTTLYNYEWDANLSASGLAGLGGWVTTTTNAANRTSVARTDIYGRQVSGSDFGDHSLTYAYDAAGRLIYKGGTGSEETFHIYLDTGKIGQTEVWSRSYEQTFILDGQDNFTTFETKRRALYTYDAVGNLVGDLEFTGYGVKLNLQASPEVNFEDNSAGRYRIKGTGVMSAKSVYRNAEVQYDALGRLINWTEKGENPEGYIGRTSPNIATSIAAGYANNGVGRPTGTPLAPKAYKEVTYDANGNVRSVKTRFDRLNANGTLNVAAADSDLREQWYLYDMMNQVIVNDGDRGRFGEIFRGAVGESLSYDRVGRRHNMRSGGTGFTPEETENILAQMRLWTGLDDSASLSDLYERFIRAQTDASKITDPYYQEGGGGGLVADFAAIANLSFSTITGMTATRKPEYTDSETYSYQAGTDLITQVDRTVSGRADKYISTFGYDIFGRKTTQLDYSVAGNTTKNYYSENYTYDDAGRVTYSATTSYLSGGANTTELWHYYYGESIKESLIGPTWVDLTTASAENYRLGQATLIHKRTKLNGAPKLNNVIVKNYDWFGGAVLRSESYIALSSYFNRGQDLTRHADQYYAYRTAGRHENINITVNQLSESGRILHSFVEDDRDRLVVFDHDVNGQIIKREELDRYTTKDDPVSFWHRLGTGAGTRVMGEITNDKPFGASTENYSTSVGQRTVAGDKYAFAGGSANGTSYALLSPDAPENITSYYQGSSVQAGSGAYTATGGETLSQVALQMWGDSSLWYKIADANGLISDVALIAGQSLHLPGGVVRNSFNADTITPYNEGELIGDLSPQTLKPKKPKKPKKKKCGFLGKLLMAVVAVAVTVVTGGGALGAMLGSVVSQGVGLATGVIDKFSFKAVALAGITAVVGGALGELKSLQSLPGAGNTVTNIVRGAARGALSSGISQGIGVATGMQDKFSWAGVAGAGVAGGAIGGLHNTGLGSSLSTNVGGGRAGEFLSRMVSGSVTAVANAATRSVLTGENFGDSLVTAIPDVIGQALGNALGACFVAGTPVHTPHGLRPIEEIKLGDWVYSRDDSFNTDKVCPRRVIDLYRFEDRATLDVTIAFDDDTETDLRTTPEHPFAVLSTEASYDAALEDGRILNAELVSITKSRAKALA